MGKVGNAAIQARARARDRRIAMETGRQERDDRIDAATAAVILANAEIATGRAAAAPGKAAALAAYEVAIAAADQSAVTGTAEQDQVIGAAVRALLGEKLSAGRVAALTELTTVEVRRLARGSNPADAPAQQGSADPPR